MAFDANRDIKVEASQAEDGTFSLRTKGLASRKRPELEVVGVPEPAIRAAAVILNQTADYTVNRAEVVAGQNVGFELAVEEDDAPLMLAVRTVQAAAPEAGLWNKLTGGGKGVLRLVDVADDEGKTPFTALATMLVHRARARLAKDDASGAREELVAAIATFPGKPAKGAAPTIGSGSSVYNAQNHRAYLALAELVGGEEGEAAFGEALRRSQELSRRELGATLAEIAVIDEATARVTAEAILEANLGAPAVVSPGPTPNLVVVASPLWEADEGGAPRSLRRAALIPAAFTQLYFESGAVRGLREHGASLATAAFMGARAEPWKLAWRLRDLRGIWIDRHADAAAEVPHHPAAGLLSTILLAVARGFRAGGTEAEIGAWLAGRPAPGLVAALETLDAWEADQYLSAMSPG